MTVSGAVDGRAVGTIQPVVASFFTADASRDRVRTALAAGCRYVEIRADGGSLEDASAIVRELRGRAVVTLRHACEGGRWEGDEGDRERFYARCLEDGAACVDLELASEGAARLRRSGFERLPADRVVLSMHVDVPPGNAELGAMEDALTESGTIRGKLVFRAREAADNLVARDAVARRGMRGRLACFATGPFGIPSRVLAPSWGSWATYGAGAADARTADGQLPAEALVNEYAVGGITCATALYGLVGEAVVESSPSPAMHAAGYAAVGADARYLPLPSVSVEDADRVRRGAGFRGLGVTMPFKERAARRCAALHGDAAAIGAVNTVRCDGDVWEGWNTDPVGLRSVLARVGAAPAPGSGARAVVVGAGGTGRTAAWVLREAGYAVAILNRTPERAAALASATGAETVPWSEVESIEAEVWVQTTPLRAFGWRAPFGPRTRALVDFVYGARPTEWVREGRLARAVRVVDGAELLAAQGVEQFRVLCGEGARFETFETAARTALADRRDA